MKTVFRGNVETIYFLRGLQSIWQAFIKFQILSVGKIHLQSIYKLIIQGIKEGKSLSFEFREFKNHVLRFVCYWKPPSAVKRKPNKFIDL